MELLRFYIKHYVYEHYIPYKEVSHNGHSLHAVMIKNIYIYIYIYIYILVHIIMIDSQCHIHSE